MSKHPNVATVDRMTQAIIENDRDTLTKLFTDDIVLHMRGALPSSGDHHGVDEFLRALGTVFEMTDGDVKLEQLFCIGDGPWAAEWEQAVFGRHGRTFETNNAFIYHFREGRIAEMWMINTAPAGSESFWL